jgi:type I restriction enzyme R subunit
MRPHIDGYNRLARLYRIIRNAFGRRVYADRDFMAKTERLVQEHVTAQGLVAEMPVQKLDEKTLAALKAASSSDTIKIINLTKSIQITVSEEGAANPFLWSIGERAEAVVALPAPN